MNLAIIEHQNYIATSKQSYLTAKKSLQWQMPEQQWPLSSRILPKDLYKTHILALYTMQVQHACNAQWVGTTTQYVPVNDGWVSLKYF